MGGVAVNYARLSLTRPDYGYAGPGQDPLEDEEWPEKDGLWTMDLKTGETKLILPVSAGRSQMPATKVHKNKPGQHQGVKDNRSFAINSDKFAPLSLRMKPLRI